MNHNSSAIFRIIEADYTLAVSGQHSAVSTQRSTPDQHRMVDENP